MSKYFLFVILVFVLSCGKDSKDSTSAMIQMESQNPIMEGEYRAIIRPINTRVNGIIASGLAKINVERDQFNIDLYMDDLGGVAHKQYLYSGDCPTLSKDINNDKIIDINELSGRVILSLDNDLTSETPGNEIYPIGRGYNYSETASLAKMIGNLKVEAENYIFNLDRKVIVIFGAPTSTSVPIPSSVATINSEPTHLNIPVACGAVEKL